MRRSSSSPSSMQIRLLFLFVIFFIVNVFFLNIALEQQQSGQSSSTQQSAASTTTRNILLEQQEPVFGKEESRRDPDGVFNGYPVYYYDGETAEKVGGKKKYFFSSSHCIGENYQADTSWIYRSCHYTFFCFDLKQQDFVVFQPPDHNDLNSSEILQQRPYMDTSQSWLRPPLQNNHVALGGGKKFTPRIVASGNYPKSIFALDENVIMIPFVHSSMFDSNSNSNSNSTSPWLLIWDDFLPIYTLMTIFELQDNAALLLHTTSRHDGGGEKIGCDSYIGKSRDDKDNNCETFFSTFWPLMRSPRYNKSILTTTRHVEWNVNVSQSSNNNNKLSQYVCSRHGLSGVGDETDHGLRKVKSHGWEKRKYSEITINHGRRAPILWSFRQFVMKNVGIQDVPLKLPYRIVISSTAHFPSTSVVVDTLKRNLDPNFAVVTVNDFTSSQSSALEEQLRIASEAAVFIVGCCSDGNDDGAAVVAPFVQKGSSIVIYYPRLMRGIIQQGNNKAVKRDEEPPATGRIDWDILNNLGYSNVHWLPREGIAENQETLVTLVKAELSRIHGYLG